MKVDRTEERHLEQQGDRNIKGYMALETPSRDMGVKGSHIQRRRCLSTKGKTAGGVDLESMDF